MTLPRILSLALTTLLITSCSQEMTQQEETQTRTSMYEKLNKEAPVAKKVAKEMTIHDDTRVDNYYWLNQREDQEVIDYLNAENDYTSAVMEDTKQLQDDIYNEIVGRIKQDDESVPFRDNGYFYITRYEEGKEYPIHSRKKGSLEADEEIMLNLNELAADYSYYAVGGRSVSPDNQLLAYGEDTLSRRIYTLRFKDLTSGEILADKIPGTTGRAVWANDNQTVFYSTKDEALRSFKIFKHKLGTPATDDVEIYHEEDETFSTYVYKSKSKKYIIIANFQTVSNEYHVLNADTPDGKFRVIQP
ncbi:MAG: oligopeptidase B, partial [Saprospiraceae bacterium]